MKFTSLTISPETAAVKWLLIMSLLSVQLESLQRKRITRFDHGHLLQPKHGASAVQMRWSTLLSFALNRGVNFVGK